MNSKNIPGDIKSKSIKETREEINQILDKIEQQGVNLDNHHSDFERLLKLNNHISDLFKKKFKEISALGKKNVKK